MRTQDCTTTELAGTTRKNKGESVNIVDQVRIKRFFEVFEKRRTTIAVRVPAEMEDGPQEGELGTQLIA